MLLLIVLVVLVLVLFGGGFGVRGHEQYGNYSGAGIGLGGILLMVLVVLFFTGNLRLN